MRVLIAVEDELYAAAIAEFIASHTWKAGSMIKIVHAVEPSYVGDRVTAIYGNDLQNEILKDRVEYGQKLVKQTKEDLERQLDATIPVETNVTVGRPHHVILQAAQDWKADMLVLGSHGRTGFSKFLMGSVSMAVLSHAPCSTVIVRLPNKAKAGSESQKEASSAEPAALSR